MPRPACRLVHDADRADKAKPEVKEPLLQGLWWAVTEDCEITSLDGLQPEDWPSGVLFLRPGTMSPSATARVLQALALQMEHSGAMH